MATETHLQSEDYQRLAAFRFSLRRFIAKTEANARSSGLTPQQHQALLSIKGGYPGRDSIAISELADHLIIKNNSAVELVNRLVKTGLVTRETSSEDRRTICVRITRKGDEVLADLSRASLDELATSANAMRQLVAELERPRSHTRA
jgi:DNA-binding MarR family transcriptional regulator